MNDMKFANDDIIGKEVIKFYSSNDEDDMIFECSDGSKYKLYHEQDCCETVNFIERKSTFLEVPFTIFSINYDMDSKETEDGSETDTYVTIQTDIGDMALFWHGESNGYYGESVELAKEQDGYYSSFVE